MSFLKIARMGHPVLRRKTSAVDLETLQSEAFQQFLDDMVETMRDAEGVGLAAPQVYRPVRALVAEVKAGGSRDSGQSGLPLTVLVNPKVVAASEELDAGWEGCLSIPDLRGMVPRARAIRVQALTREGEPQLVELVGFYARVIQHEIDHLDGVLFLDRMTDLTSLTFLKEFERYWQPESEE
ncbi:MAG TPA: peptide deformylase [Armatimonadota bacterium]|jgi:peptide deformylase